MILANLYFLQAFNFRYFRTPHDSAKIKYMQRNTLIVINV